MAEANDREPARGLILKYEEEGPMGLLGLIGSCFTLAAKLAWAGLCVYFPGRRP